MHGSQVIPVEAVEAAAKAIHRYDVREGLASTYAPNENHRAEARLALEAAAPHMLAPIIKLADEWHEQGEELMADSKTFQMDEHISVELLKEGATMVENARHIRNAIAGTK